jgi:hypothetical protein
MLKTTLAAFIASAGIACADAPVIQSYEVAPDTNGWRFTVTIAHADSGWDDYAQAWRILDEQGNVLGHRSLIHPHEGFPAITRSLSNVKIPQHIKVVQIQTHDTLGGWRPETKRVSLSSTTHLAATHSKRYR